MLHVRAVDVFVPGQAGQVRRLQLLREGREAHDVEVILREGRADERVERERDLLRREEASPEQHRTRDVDEDGRRRLRHELGPVHVEVLGFELHRDVRAVAEYRVAHGRRQVEEERIAELVRLQLIRRIAAASAHARAVAAERVALEGREDLFERALADLADPARCQLVALAILADEARLLEELDHLLQLFERLTRAGASQALDLIGVERVEVVHRSCAAHDLFHVRELIHLVHEAERLGQRDRLVAAHGVLVAVRRHHLRQRFRELVHRGLQSGIVERGAEQLLELIAHVARHRLPQRTHRRHALGQLTEQVVPVLRAAGELGVLPLEGLEVGLAALHPLLQGAVEVADHLPRPLELFGREILQRLAHVLEVRAQDLLLQLLEELLIFLGRLRFDELVILQRADRAAEILRQRVELREALLREPFHGLMQLFVRRLGGAAPLEALALEPLHVLELFFQLVERRVEVVPLGAPLLRGAKPLEQILHPLHAAGDAPARQPRHRVLEVATGEQLVGHRGEQLLGLEGVETLRPVPALVLDVAIEIPERRSLVHAQDPLATTATGPVLPRRALAPRPPVRDARREERAAVANSEERESGPVAGGALCVMRGTCSETRHVLY